MHIQIPANQNVSPQAIEQNRPAAAPTATAPPADIPVAIGPVLTVAALEIQWRADGYISIGQQSQRIDPLRGKGYRRA
jgi:hypothetical protein